MTPTDSSFGTVYRAIPGRDGVALEPHRPHGPRTDGSGISKSRRTPAMVGASLGLAALVLAGCGVLPGTDNDDVAMEPMEPATPEVPPMDVLLLSDFLRFYLDGDMGMDRGFVDCYGGLCVQTDGERILINLPEFYAFAGHHDEYITALEDTIQDRNGIMIGDVSAGMRPDIPGVAVDRETTGWGGWGEYVGFDAIYYDYVRYDEDVGRDRPQRIVEASLGGYSSPGNPVGENLRWTGGAVAIDHSVITETRNLVGDSELNLVFYEPLEEYFVYVDITDLADVVSGTTYDDMSWKNMPLRDGGFSTFQIRGQFFGPNHEEVGGVFERDSITGGFAATREE